MGGPQRLAESSPDRGLCRHLDLAINLAIKSQGLQSPANRIGNGASGPWRRLAGQEVCEQRRTDVASPRQPSPHGPKHLTPDPWLRQASCVGRAEHQLAGRRPGAVELAGEVIGGAGPAPVEPLAAPGKPDPVLLQPVPQAGLGHGLALLELMHELNDLSQQITGELRPEAGAHPAKQQATEARAGAVL